MSNETTDSPSIDLDTAINSLMQQTTILGLAIGAMMKQTSLNQPELAAKIEEDLFPLYARLQEKFTDPRSRDLIDLLRTGITEGRPND